MAMREREREREREVMRRKLTHQSIWLVCLDYCFSDLPKEYHTYCLNPPLASIPQGNITLDFHQNVWEFTTYEGTFLLKFLSNELLNSALIRQHLEHCTESSAVLQQKLRSVSIEWRNLKSKEETVVANVAKTDKSLYFRSLEEKSAGKSLNTEVLNTEDCHKDAQAVEDKSFKQKEVLPSNIVQQEPPNDLSGVNSLQGGMTKYVEKDDSTLPSPQDLQGLCPPLDMKSSQVGELEPSTGLNESQAYSLELNSAKNEISFLQGSVRGMEMKLMKISLRGEYLGSDSAGRLYSVVAKLSGHPWLIVNSVE